MSLWFSKVIGPLARGLAVASVALIMGAAVLGVLEILARWILRYSLVGMTEISTVAIILGVCGCFPYCLLVQGNITIRVFSQVKSVAVQRSLEFFSGVLILAVFLVMAYQMWLHAVQLRVAGSASLILKIPMGVVWSIAAALVFLGAVIQLFVVTGVVSGGVSNSPDTPLSSREG